MADYDAIVIGAGHNGLTAAAILQRAGLQTLCLDSKLYAGGMASTVELFDGYKFEIAGSLQFPTSKKVSGELGLDELPSVDLDVMSVSLRGIGDDPVVYYTDPMKLLTHLNDVHGAEAVNGMAGLMASPGSVHLAWRQLRLAARWMRFWSPMAGPPACA